MILTTQASSAAEVGHAGLVQPQNDIDARACKAAIAQ